MIRSTVARLARFVHARRPPLLPARQRRGHSIETLEARIAPATVSINGGAAQSLGTAGTYSVTVSGGNLLFQGVSFGAVETVTSVVLNGESVDSFNSGNDTFNLAALPGFSGSLTINGNTGNDHVNFTGNLTLAAGQSLDVDMENDGGALGLDQITVSRGVVLATSGTGGITLAASGGIVILPDASLSTVDGDLILKGNSSGTAAGDFKGVLVGFDATGGPGSGVDLVTTGSGNIFISGSGGDDPASFAHNGVDLDANVKTAGTGSISIMGTGGDSHFGASGIAIGNATPSIAKEISSHTGITMVGTATEAGATNGIAGGSGVSIGGTMVVKTTGSAPISLTGEAVLFGNAVVSAGVGFNFSTSGALAGQVKTDAGTITVTGTAGDYDLSSGISQVGLVTTTAGSIVYITDKVNIGTGSELGTVDAGSGTVTLKQKTDGVAIILGPTTNLSTNTMGISDAELDRITAGTVIIGDANSGLITIHDVISPTSYQTLDLEHASRFDNTGGFDSHVTSATVYSKIVVNGAFAINPGATLSVSGSYVPAQSDSFTILEHIAGGTTTGNFTGKTEGSSFPGAGGTMQISYAGGLGDDVVLSIPPPIADVSVAVSPASTVESSGSPLTYTFTRSVVTTDALTVNFNVSGTTTASGISADYTLTGATSFGLSYGTVTFAPNATVATVLVTPLRDSFVEGNEVLTLTVAAGSGGNSYHITGSAATGTIVDDAVDFGDAPASYGTTGPGAASHVAIPGFYLGHYIDAEADGQPNATATGDQYDDGVSLPTSFAVGSTATIGVNASLTGRLDGFIDWNRDGDFNDPGEKVFDNVALAAHGNEFTIEVPAGASLGTSYARFRLSSAGGLGPTGAAPDGEVEDYAVTISNTSVSVSAPHGPIGEEGSSTLDYTFTRTGDTTAPLNVNFRLSGSAGYGSDYYFRGAETYYDATGLGYLSIPAGSSSAVLKVVPLNDTLVEGNEQVILAVSAAEGYVPSGSPAIGTITDNDTATISFEAATSNAPEGTTPHLVNVKLTTFSPEGPASLQNDFTVFVQDHGGSGAHPAVGGGVDYTFNEQSLTFSAGDAGSTKTVSASIVNDTVAEANETFQLGLSATPGNTAGAPIVTIDPTPHTVTIVDNDGVDLQLTTTQFFDVRAPGQVIVYTLHYHNGGFVTADGVSLGETIPAHTSFDAADSSRGWQDDGGLALADGALEGTPIHFSLGSVPASGLGNSDSIYLAVKVHATVPAGAGTIENTATIGDDHASGADLAPGDNSASLSTTLHAAPDLHLTETDDTHLIIRGQTLHTAYTITNEGNQDAAGVGLTVHLPEGTTFDASASTGGEWTAIGSGNYLLQLGALGAQSSATVTFGVDVNTTRVDGLHQVNTMATVSDPEDANLDHHTATNADPIKIYEGIYAVSQGTAVAGKFGTPTVHVYDPVDGHELYHFDAYESKLRASVRVAVADINGDGFDDIITTVGAGTGRLRVFDGLTGAWLHDEASYTGPFKNEIAVFSGKGIDRGAFVAAGDLTGDGHADIVVGTALGGNKVRVFDGLTGAPRAFGPSGDTFLQPFGKTFRGGVHVAVGDVLGDGRADLAVAMGFYGSEVKVYDGGVLNPALTTPSASLDFKVGPKTYRGGLTLALGDLDHDGKLDLITGRNWSRPTLVETFSGLLKDAQGNPQLLGAGPIDPFDQNPLRPTYVLGVRVAAIDFDFDGVADIIAASGGNNKSAVNIYSGADHHLLRTFSAIPGTPNSALFVAGTAVSPVVAAD